MGDNNIQIRFKVTESQYIDQMPVVDGQVIILSDSPKMFYDMNSTRFEVGAQYWELYTD